MPLGKPAAGRPAKEAARPPFKEPRQQAGPTQGTTAQAWRTWEEMEAKRWNHLFHAEHKHLWPGDPRLYASAEAFAELRVLQDMGPLQQL